MASDLPESELAEIERRATTNGPIYPYDAVKLIAALREAQVDLEKVWVAYAAGYNGDKLVNQSWPMVALNIWSGVKSLRADLARVEGERDRLLRTDQPWPLRDVLIKLEAFTSALLDRVDYDTLGWEEYHAARAAARDIIAALTPPNPEKE